MRRVVVVLGAGPPCPAWPDVDTWVRLGPPAEGDASCVRTARDFRTGLYTVLACAYWTEILWWPSHTPWPTTPPAAAFHDRHHAWQVYHQHLPALDEPSWLRLWPTKQ